jgi:hypothetical protein
MKQKMNLSSLEEKTVSSKHKDSGKFKIIKKVSAKPDERDSITDDCNKLKATVNRLKAEASYYRAEFMKLQSELKKHEKIAENDESNFKTKDIIFINKIRKQFKDKEKEYREKVEELDRLKSNLRSTNLNEIIIQNNVFKEELTKLRKLIPNDNKASKSEKNYKNHYNIVEKMHEIIDQKSVQLGEKEKELREMATHLKELQIFNSSLLEENKRIRLTGGSNISNTNIDGMITELNDLREENRKKSEELDNLKNAYSIYQDKIKILDNNSNFEIAGDFNEITLLITKILEVNQISVLNFTDYLFSEQSTTEEVAEKILNILKLENFPQDKQTMISYINYIFKNNLKPSEQNTIGFRDYFLSLYSGIQIISNQEIESRNKNLKRHISPFRILLLKEFSRADFNYTGYICLSDIKSIYRALEIYLDEDIEEHLIFLMKVNNDSSLFMLKYENIFNLFSEDNNTLQEEIRRRSYSINSCPLLISTSELDKRTDEIFKKVANHLYSNKLKFETVFPHNLKIQEKEISYNGMYLKFLFRILHDEIKISLDVVDSMSLFTKLRHSSNGYNVEIIDLSKLQEEINMYGLMEAEEGEIEEVNNEIHIVSNYSAVESEKENHVIKEVNVTKIESRNESRDKISTKIIKEKTIKMEIEEIEHKQIKIITHKEEAKAVEEITDHDKEKISENLQTEPEVIITRNFTNDLFKNNTQFSKPHDINDDMSFRLKAVDEQNEKQLVQKGTVHSVRSYFSENKIPQLNLIHEIIVYLTCRQILFEKFIFLAQAKFKFKNNKRLIHIDDLLLYLETRRIIFSPYNINLSLLENLLIEENYLDVQELKNTVYVVEREDVLSYSKRHSKVMINGIFSSVLDSKF